MLSAARYWICPRLVFVATAGALFAGVSAVVGRYQNTVATTAAVKNK